MSVEEMRRKIEELESEVSYLRGLCEQYNICWWGRKR